MGINGITLKAYFLLLGPKDAFEINADDFKIGRLCYDIINNSLTTRVRFPIADVNIICVRNTDRFFSDLFRIANCKDEKQVPLCVKSCTVQV